ncbi:MAG: hypothetical protein ACI4PM_00275 [Butyricicoccus sp.]
MVGLDFLCCNGCSNRCPLSEPCCQSGEAKAEELTAIAERLAKLEAKVAECGCDK